MSYVIYKYPLQRGMPNVIPDGDVVRVAAQQPSDAATGEDLSAAGVHLGSAVCAGGSLVWHVYAIS